MATAVLTDRRGIFLLSMGAVVITLAVLHITIELLQLIALQRSYFSEWDNYLQIILFLGTIVFVLAQLYAGITNCWCASGGVWQIGAAMVACSWFNLIVLFKNFPHYGIGSHITLLLKICRRYLEVIYLPILLMVSFGFSFYMLLAVTQVTIIDAKKSYACISISSNNSRVIVYELSLLLGGHLLAPFSVHQDLTPYLFPLQ